MKKLALFLVCSPIYVTMFGVVAPYSAQDKKDFDSLTNITITKRVGGERKVKRIEDLNILSALMINRLLSILKERDIYETLIGKTFEGKVRDYVKKAIGRQDLFGAARYAVNSFEKEVEGGFAIVELQLSKKIFPNPEDRIIALRIGKEDTLWRALQNYFDKYYKQVAKALKDLGAQPAFSENVIDNLIVALKKSIEKRMKGREAA